MFKTFTILFILTLTLITKGFSQTTSQQKLTTQYHTAIEFTDAAINSISALNSLIKKENYRNKISNFNNPTSSDMGFNLQLEINIALKPLLEKARNVNPNKFTDIVGSLIGNQNKSNLVKGLIPTVGIFSTLTSLVGNLVVTEKKITKSDLDTFVLNISKYFGQYEKLNQANQQFDIKIDKIDLRLQELQTDLKENIIDLIISYNSTLQRNSLKQKTTEELLLKYLDKYSIDTLIEQQINNEINSNIVFPSDAIKSAKDITGTIQKIFAEYQKIYTNNFNDIKNILQETKQLGKNINIQAIDNSIAELQTLYTESKNADILNLRLSTLTERLKLLVATEKIK